MGCGGAHPLCRSSILLVALCYKIGAAVQPNRRQPRRCLDQPAHDAPVLNERSTRSHALEQSGRRLDRLQNGCSASFLVEGGFDSHAPPPLVSKLIIEIISEL